MLFFADGEWEWSQKVALEELIIFLLLGSILSLESIFQTHESEKHVFSYDLCLMLAIKSVLRT